MIHHFRQWRWFCSKYDVLSSFWSTTQKNECSWKSQDQQKLSSAFHDARSFSWTRRLRVANLSLSLSRTIRAASMQLCQIVKKRRRSYVNPRSTTLPKFRNRCYIVCAANWFSPTSCCLHYIVSFNTSLSSIIYVPQVQFRQHNVFGIFQSVQALTVLRGSKSLSTNRGPIRDCTFPCWLSFFGNEF